MSLRTSRILLRVIFWTVILGFAATQAWAGRFLPFVADSVSYLDMADYIAKGQFGNSLSSYWSPAYPAVIAFLLFLIKPPLTDLFAVMKIANLLIFVGVGLAFEYFLNQLLALYRENIAGEKGKYLQLSEPLFRALSYMVFAWAFLSLAGANEDTPDYLLSFFIILACAMTLQIQRNKSSDPKIFAVLGFSLGCAYMTKAFAAVLVPLFFAFTLLPIKQRKEQLTCFLAAASIFAIVSLPYGIALSAQGRTSTVLAATRLNYLWTVLNGPSILDDYSPAYKHLNHPLQKVSEHPKTYYFGRPIPGSFPLWYDVGYWTDGVEVKFSPFDSAIVFIADWLFFWYHFLCYVFWSWLIVGVICARLPFSRASIVSMRVPLTVSLWSLFCYSIVVNVITEQPATLRYFPSYTVLLFCAFIGMLRIPRTFRSRVAIYAMCAVTCTYCFFDLKKEVRVQKRFLAIANHHDQDTAVLLNKNGLKPGDDVALLSSEKLDMVWTRMAGLRIAAAIAEPLVYWEMTPEARKNLNRKLKDLNIKAIVFKTTAADATDPSYWANFAEVKLKPTNVQGQFVLDSQKVDKLKVFDAREGWKKVAGANYYFLPL